jgi:hypothetical protein
VTRHCRAGEIALGSRRVSFVAFLRTRAEIYRRPGSARLATLPRLSKSFVATSRRGVPTVVTALAEVRASDCGVSWYRVRLSGKPGVSGATEGYVPADSVALAEVHTRVFVVRERIRITNSSSTFGAAAIGLSAFSEKLIHWPQGGPVAIHGTSNPDSIGKAVSHGCVRLGARDLERLFKRAQIGTPVEIVE